MKKEKNANLLAYLAVTFGNVIWGFSFMFMRIGMDAEGSTPTLMLSARFLVGLVAGFLLLLLKREKVQLRGKNWKGLILLALVETAYFFFETYGIYYTNSTFSGVILSMVPVVSIATGAIFLHEYPGWRRGLLCLVPIAGVILITLSGSALGVITPIGILFLLLTCVFSALFKTVNRSIAKDFSPLVRTISSMAGSCIFYTIFGLGSVDWDFAAFVRPWADTSFLLAVLAMGVFCSIAANTLVNYAAGKMSVVRLSVFGAFSTVVATLAGVIFLDEPMTVMIAVGAVLCIVGVWMVNRPQTQKKSEAVKE